jgi:hypothetical protein
MAKQHENAEGATNDTANGANAQPAAPETQSNSSKMFDSAKAFFAEAFDRKTRIECVRIAGYTVAFFGTLCLVGAAFGSKNAA